MQIYLSSFKFKNAESLHNNLQKVIALSQVYGSGNALQCWNPAQFTGAMEEYVHDFCLVENTYYLPINARIPTDTRRRDDEQLTYYQVCM